MKSGIVLALVATAAAQQSIDLASKDAVLKAAKAATWPLRMFYDANKQSRGAWIEQFDDGKWNVQWHESGEYWGMFYRYMQYSGDNAYLDWVDTEMQLSVGGNTDFLDGMNPILEISGRWNDDIGWWGLSTMTAAETFGMKAVVAPKNLSPGYNPTYFELTKNTFDEIYMQWEAQCGGGIFWSRSRTSGTENQRYYKSTITNVEEMELGARLFALTGDASYKTKVDQIYAWLKSSGLITSDYTIYDGVDVRTCAAPNKEVYSYHSGPLLSALATMYRITKDATYLAEGNNVYNAVVKNFVSPTDNTLSVEPMCTTGSCKSPHGYAWPVLTGMADWYTATTDDTVRSSIEKVLRATATKNFQGCDSNWYCIRNLPAATAFTLKNGTNPRDQFDTVSILNALAVVNGNALQRGGGGNQNAGSGVPAATVTPSKGGAMSWASIPVGLVSFALAMVL